MDNQIILSADGQQSEKSVIIYRSEDGTIQLEVQLHEETVWLTQAQMAILFETTRNNITIHIGNLFREGELDKISVCKDSLLTASDGKPYKTKIYNLDVIISVGYRVKSKRGTDFRKWANKVIKDFILKGYAVNNRLDILEVKVYKLKKETNSPLCEICQLALAGIREIKIVEEHFRDICDICERQKILISCRKMNFLLKFFNTFPLD